jgi:hypothetical protein
MTITIGGFTCQTLTAQPFGYEGEARTGLTARTFQISGLLTPAQWQSLLSVYTAWRNTRITDVDTALSGVVGTTVALTVAANGVSVSALACWFADPPSGEQAGAYISASVTLVDAAHALDVLFREQEKNRQRSESTVPSFGDWFIVTATPDKIVPSLGGGEIAAATIVLIADPVTYQDGPALTLAATGVHVVQGPLTATKVRRIEGTTTSAGWSVIQTWYEEVVTYTPEVNTWFPISLPTSTAEIIILNGAKSTRYTVTFDLALVK